MLLNRACRLLDIAPGCVNLLALNRVPHLHKVHRRHGRRCLLPRRRTFSHASLRSFGTAAPIPSTLTRSLASTMDAQGRHFRTRTRV